MEVEEEIRKSMLILLKLLFTILMIILIMHTGAFVLFRAPSAGPIRRQRSIDRSAERTLSTETNKKNGASGRPNDANVRRRHFSVAK